MGACFNTHTFDGKLNTHDLTKAYNALVDELRDQYGADAYNGTFTTLNGLAIEDRVFETRQEADNYLADKAQKWQDAIAVKFKDVRKETTKEPTFNGHKRDECVLSSTGDYTLQAVVRRGERIDGQYSTATYVADQLAESHKTKLLALYNDYAQKAQAFQALHDALVRLIANVGDVLFTPEPTVFADIKKLHKQRAKAHKSKTAAGEKLKAFDLKQAAKLYATKQVDHGTQWLVGGWCAE